MQTPTRLQDLSTAWLQHALQQTGTLNPTTEVLDLGLERIGVGMGILDDLARLRPAYRHGEGPVTLVAKFPTTAPAHQYGVELHFYEREVRFYHELAERVPLRIPQCFLADPEACVLLLEDLGAEHPGDQVQGCTLEEARLVVRKLARLHAAFWGQTQGLEWLDEVQAAAQTYIDCFPDNWTAFVQRFGDAIPASCRHFDQVVAAEADSMARRLSRQPATLLHGDFRLDNLMFLGTDELAVLDWQTLCRGQGGWDLGWFLGGNLDPAVCRENLDLLLEDYHTALGIGSYPLAECREDYRAGVVLALCRIIHGSAHLEMDTQRGRDLLSCMIDRLEAAATVR